MFRKQNENEKNNEKKSNSGANSRNNEQIMGFDFLEFDKQRKEDLLNKKYLKVEIIVVKNEEPYICVKNSNVSADEVARMLVSMDIVKNDLIDRCPTAIMKAHFIKTSTTTVEIPFKGDDSNNAKGKM